ncbi:MAG: UDP-4-amino-4,6-dideoxy-N-acetyl-beta-L-altrosamine transaminase [Lachnospiraceae bacterium]|nr:UDP-4-amino-4,6-dideoxy-N-acetyl-beta-L-altrosamine transaminase [Lachnospiraceae bacterium]
MDDNIPAIAGGTPIRENKIYYAHQYIDDADIKAVTDVLKSDYLTCGPAIDRMEEKLKKITGAKYAAACSNGTSALHIVCMALGIGEGDEVIVPPITFAASSNCVLYCGGTPVFADVDPKTYLLDPKKVEEKITEKTKAVITVDYGGQASPLPELLDICRKHSLKLIEDAAHSIGTVYKGLGAVGSVADVTTFSFHPVKVVTGGEGGAITTNDPEVYSKALLYRSHGITRDRTFMEGESEGPWYYEQTGLSMNYRMTDIQAALISSQLDKLPEFKARRQEIVRMYDEAFSKIPGITVQQEIPESDTARHLYVIRVQEGAFEIDRAGFFDALVKENIIPNVHYIPVYLHPYYRHLGYAPGLCPEAEKIYREMITLPLFYSMTDSDVSDVTEAVKRIADHYRK